VPFLSEDEFTDHVGGNLASKLVKTSASFEAAERGAAATIERLTGAEAPPDAADAPPWAKQPAARLVLYALAGQVEWSEERMSWVRDARQAALDELRARAERIEASPDDETVGEVQPIGGTADL
jgi:hypothetical protein